MIIYPNTVSEYFRGVREVLNLLKAAAVTLRFAKCTSFEAKVVSLGHFIRPVQLLMYNINCDAIKKVLLPTKQTNLRSLLGI